MDVDLARRNRIPFDWGLEVGMLAEVFRNSTPRAICQAELCENYDHKHQALSPRDPEKGLNRMAVDIMRSIFRRMASEGIKLDRGLFDTLQFAYTRHAEDILRAYGADTVKSGLAFPRHEEEGAVTTFARSIREAAQAHLGDPASWPLIPNWNRVESALPGFPAALHGVVEQDGQAGPFKS
jgi:glucosyl-3-phosphoglycerate synthase